MSDANKMLQDWIGRTVEAEDVVTPRALASFRATFSPHLAATPGDEAPLGLHWCLAPEIADGARLNADGHVVKGDFLPPIPLPRRMWASGELTFLAPLRLGDRVRRRSEIAEIVEKTGRIGSLFFVVVQHKWENQLGPVIEESQTLVYREAALANAERQPAPRQSDSPSAASIQCVDIDTIRLFRYSALTFNSHRIHYDAPYAVELEQYSGLVIHGPLQATLLLNHAAGVGGRALRRFSFRGARPATGAQILSLEGVLGEVDSMALTVRNAHGLVTLTAEARWR